MMHAIYRPLALLLIISLLANVHAQRFDQLVPIEKAVNGTVSPGYIFITPNSLDNPVTRPVSLMILDEDGDAVFFKPQTDVGVGPYPVWRASGFKLQASGLLSYSTRSACGASGIYLVDGTIWVVDPIYCANGLTTDGHDISHTVDGKYHLVCVQDSTMDANSILTDQDRPESLTGWHLSYLLRMDEGTVRFAKY